ncbi:hypothetical protein PV326_012427 [Microctonus aethiopoides]|nr:hypothetical protein PV326_012427 [Microctonus aethiopoides]
MSIDYLARNTSHLDNQLKKARNQFKMMGRLFHNRKITIRSKIICYMLLIRPIITYAAPIWWNTSATQMEKIRMFERSCLRAATNKYRSSESEYKKWISNKKLYNETKIPRIDNFIIKITRDYFSKCKNNKNQIIKEFTNINTEITINGTEQGYPQPQAFIYLDAKGIIQDEHNIPIIYHLKRHKKNKKLPTSWNQIAVRTNPYKYSTAIPDIDSKDNHRLNPQYWWLNQRGAKHIKELKERLKKQ